MCFHHDVQSYRMKQMELSTEMEKHKKTQSELDGCSLPMRRLTSSEKGSEHSRGGEDEAVREDRFLDGELLSEGSFQ